MTKTKTGLGRGLGAVIPSYSPGVETVDADLITPNPHQPRTSVIQLSSRNLPTASASTGSSSPFWSR